MVHTVVEEQGQGRYILQNYKLSGAGPVMVYHMRVSHWLGHGTVMPTCVTSSVSQSGARTPLPSPSFLPLQKCAVFRTHAFVLPRRSEGWQDWSGRRE